MPPPLPVLQPELEHILGRQLHIRLWLTCCFTAVLIFTTALAASAIAANQLRAVDSAQPLALAVARANNIELHSCIYYSLSRCRSTLGS